MIPKISIIANIVTHLDPHQKKLTKHFNSITTIRRKSNIQECSPVKQWWGPIYLTKGFGAADTEGIRFIYTLIERRILSLFFYDPYLPTRMYTYNKCAVSHYAPI